MKRFILIILVMAVTSVCLGAVDGVVDAGDEADFRAEFANGGDVTIPAGTYTLTADASCSTDLTLTATGAVIIDCADAYGVSIIGVGTTVAFVGDTENTITVTNSLGYGINLVPSSGNLVFSADYVTWTLGSNNGPTITPHANGTCTATFTSCTVSNNQRDAFSILTVNRDTDCTITVNDCVASDNGLWQSGSDQCFTTHSNSGSGIDTIIVNGGSYTGDDTEVCYAGGASTITFNGCTLGGQRIQGGDSANVNVTNCTMTITPGLYNGIEWSSSGSCNIDGLDMVTSGSTSAHCVYMLGTGVVRIENSTLGSSGRGVYAYTGGTGTVRLKNCTVYSATNYAAIESTVAGKVYVDNCRFPNTGLQADAKIVMTDGSLYARECSFYDSSFNGAADAFVELKATCDLAVIDRCIFYDLNGSAGSFISMADGPELYFTNNIFDDSASVGILVNSGSYVGSNNCFYDITGNVLSTGSLNADDLNATVDPRLQQLGDGSYVTTSETLKWLGIGTLKTTVSSRLMGSGGLMGN